MSSTVNNSNSNSALINTINASESKMNPNVYSTKTVYPAAAVVYEKTDKSSGTIGVGNTITFDLMKYGIAQQMLFCWTKDAVQGTDAYDFMHVIDRIELLSSSKVIDTLTNLDLMAQFSNLEASQYNPVNASGIGERDVATSGTNIYCVPLVFGFFKDINTNLNLQFNEGMSVRVKFGAYSSLGKGSTQNPVVDAYLKLRYKVYNEADYSEILTQNYNEPELSVLTTGFYDENIVPVVLASGTNTNSPAGTPVELKNTDCVNDFYICVREQQATGVATDAKPPLPISRVRFTASGQELFDLTGEELVYSKLCENGFSLMGTTGSTDFTKNVVKIQQGLWEYSGGGTQSNTLSLRELNNPIITVFFDVPDLGSSPAERKYDVSVVEDSVKIVSTISSSGRVNVSLTN